MHFLLASNPTWHMSTTAHLSRRKGLGARVFRIMKTIVLGHSLQTVYSPYPSQVGYLPCPDILTCDLLEQPPLLPRQHKRLDQGRVEHGHVIIAGEVVLFPLRSEGFRGQDPDDSRGVRNRNRRTMEGISLRIVCQHQCSWYPAMK